MAFYSMEMSNSRAYIQGTISRKKCLISPDGTFFSQRVFIFLFLHKNIICEYSLEAPSEALLMSTNNICFCGEIRKCFCGEIRKTLCEYPRSTGAIVSANICTSAGLT